MILNTRMAEQKLGKEENVRRHSARFGLTVGGAFAALGFLLLYKGNAWWFAPVLAGAALIGLGAFAPKLTRSFERAWMAAGEAIGFVATRIILVVVYACVVIPTSLAAHAFGARFLEKGFRAADRSYWTPRSVASGAKDQMEKQF